MAGLHIQEFTSIVGNPAKIFQWEILIPALPISSIKAQSAQFPGVGSTDIDLYHMGQIAKFPGTVEYEHTWQCVIVESESGDVFNAMYEWKQLIHDQKTGFQDSPASFKKDVIIMGISSASIPWIKIVLKQAYPKSIDTLELDKASNTEAWKWTLLFNYDWWQKADSLI